MQIDDEPINKKQGRARALVVATNHKDYPVPGNMGWLSSQQLEGTVLARMPTISTSVKGASYLSPVLLLIDHMSLGDKVIVALTTINLIVDDLTVNIHLTIHTSNLCTQSLFYFIFLIYATLDFM